MFRLLSLPAQERTVQNRRRIPAGNLEDLVMDRLRAFLTDPKAVLDAVDPETDGGSHQSQLIERSRQIAEELEDRVPNDVKAALISFWLVACDQIRSR